MNTADYYFQEMLRPLATGWLGKIEAARQYRSTWEQNAAECMMFYNKSAAAMWDPAYARKFWKNVRAPKFQITINKAYEYVAVFAPSLLWDKPHRQVKNKQSLAIDSDLLASLGQQGQMLSQLFEQETVAREARGEITASLIGSYLNYTPGEQPGGGLVGQSELVVLDALIKGRGVMAPRPFQFPESGQVLTGNFRVKPEDLFTDPDFDTLDDCRWIAIRHRDPHWDVERRFSLPPGTLKNKSTIESNWHMAETLGSFDGGQTDRAGGVSNDLIVWYEIFSKTGVGSRMTGMETVIKDHMEKTVGDFAYLAISPHVAYPLNCPPDFLKAPGTTEQAVKQKFAWPVPFYKDSKWPVEVLDFYDDPDHSWPVAPLTPAMGELKFLNFLIPWAANRIHSSSRDFWAVASQHVDHFRKYLEEGLDQTVLPAPVTTDDIRKVISVLPQPETRFDVWQIIEMVSSLFDKRTGLVEAAYGRNEDGTQDRTAETTMARNRAVGVRPEYMRKRSIGFQGRIAGSEAAVARLYVKGDHVRPLFGNTGALLWDQIIASATDEEVFRQLMFTIETSSMERPDINRERTALQEYINVFLPIMQGYAQMTGDFAPINEINDRWSRLHNIDLQLELQPPPPPQPDPGQEMQQQFEMRKMQADMQLKQMDLQKAQIGIQALQTKSQGEVARMGRQMQVDRAKSSLQMQTDRQKMISQILMDRAKGNQAMQLDQAEHLLNLRQSQQSFLQDMRQDEESHDQEIRQSQDKHRVTLTQALANARLATRNGKATSNSGEPK